MGGAQIEASRVPGVVSHASNPYIPGPNSDRVAAPKRRYRIFSGTDEAADAWTYSLLGLICCPLCTFIGMYLAIMAILKGNRRGWGPLAFSLFGVAVTFVGVVISANLRHVPRVP